MSNSVLDHLCRGRFVFLPASKHEIRRLFPSVESVLPAPQLIFLDEEGATPLVGYPILRSEGAQGLGEALGSYLDAEEEAQVAVFTRSAFDSKAYARSWERYRTALGQVMENTLVASVGYDYAGVFWLHHSLEVARRLQEVPRRVRRADAAIGREHGDEVKYRMLSKWLDRVGDVVGEVAHALASELDTSEEELFPTVLARMRDNLLVLTEDYISPDLSELQSYFHGYLKLDGRDFRLRIRALETWVGDHLRHDPMVRAAGAMQTGDVPLDEPRQVLYRHGFARFLSQHPRYDESRMPSSEQIEIWESLLDKLKEFEILHALRKMMVPLAHESGKLVSRDRSINTTWVGGPPVLEVSPATRPMDFMAPWVVDPVVHRYGLVYDITDFSATISMLGRRETSALENAFRMSAQFQRKIDRMASSLRVRLEKYLGDGAFYSGRHPRRLLALAIRVQRLYPEFVAADFPFDRGMRVALNFGEYRLLPLEMPGSHEPQYEFFGHGLVELSRLSTGKKTQEIEDFKNYLLAQGYPDDAVYKFFAPLTRRSAELVSKIDEQRRFFAYINSNGSLINEGIVATESFVERLGSFDQMSYGRMRQRGFIVIPLETGDEVLHVGLRKLGTPSLKGLDPVPVYEIVDFGTGGDDELREIPTQPLLGSLERLFTKTMAANRSRGTESGPHPVRPL
ncbi:MAG: hypothetical protein AAGC60_02885 [Acidobacteriota bacterium]